MFPRYLQYQICWWIFTTLLSWAKINRLGFVVKRSKVKVTFSRRRHPALGPGVEWSFLVYFQSLSQDKSVVKIHQQILEIPGKHSIGRTDGSTDRASRGVQNSFRRLLRKAAEAQKLYFQLPRLYKYIVSQYTVRLMTPCVWRTLCLRNSSSVSYFWQPLNLPTAARRNRKCTKCGMTTFGRNRMSAKSAHLSTFGAETETEAEIRSTSTCYFPSFNSKFS